MKANGKQELNMEEAVQVAGGTFDHNKYDDF